MQACGKCVLFGLASDYLLTLPTTFSYNFSISLAIVTPFYGASLVETVQSDIASDKPALFDVFREGFVRLLEWGTPSRGRMLPIWAIVMPTVALGLTKYLAQ